MFHAQNNWFFMRLPDGSVVIEHQRPAGLWHQITPDHWIPLASPDCPGTVPENIIPLCFGSGGCNNSKKAKDGYEWLLQRYGKRKACVILKRIQAYFEWVKNQQATSS
jgi:hypothetical protein